MTGVRFPVGAKKGCFFCSLPRQDLLCAPPSLLFNWKRE